MRHRIPCFSPKKCAHKININQICSELNTDKQQHNSQVNERERDERATAWLVQGLRRSTARQTVTQVWAPIQYEFAVHQTVPGSLSFSFSSLIRTDIYITYTPNKLVCLAGVREPQFCYILSIISISLCDLLLLALTVVLLKFENLFFAFLYWCKYIA